jgi:hypothetical protein
MQHPGVRLYYDVSLDGKVLYRQRASRSFVKNFLLWVYAQLANDTTNQGKTTANVNTSFLLSSSLRVNGSAGTDTQGIVVGTGNTAVTSSDYKLQTIIAHGTGSGQLQYAVQVFNTPTTDATGTQFVLTRTFTNGSGAQIDVYETGIYALNSASTFCIARDVLPAVVHVPAGQALTVTYTFKTVI